MSQRKSFHGGIWISIAAALLTTTLSNAQSSYTWNSASTSGVWLNPSNWTGGTPTGVFPGITNGGLPNEGNALDTAIFGNITATIATNGVGIDFTSGSGANGQLGIGAIQLSAAAGSSLRIGNSSSAPGDIVLNGSTVSTIPNVVLANTSGARNLSIENTQSGSGSQTMRLAIGTVTTNELLVSAGGTITINTQIYENAFNSGIRLQGGGTLVLGATNLFNGSVAVIGASTVSVNQDTNLGAAPTIPTAGRIVLDSGTLNITSGFTLNTFRGMSIGPAVGNGSGTINVASGQTLAYGGVIANNGGTGSLMKTGAGVLTLTGASAYTGATTINAGTLTVGTGGSLAAASPVAVNNTATLSGTGTINGTVTVASGGTLAGGTNGAGTLTVGGNTLLSNGGRLAIGLAAPGTNSRINILGTTTTFNFISGSILELTPKAGFGAGGNFTLVSLPAGAGNNILLNGSLTTPSQVLGTYVQGSGASGSVTITPTGFTLSTGDTFTLRRNGDAVVLSFQPVPEPQTVLAIAAAGLGLLLVCRWRKT